MVITEWNRADKLKGHLTLMSIRMMSKHLIRHRPVRVLLMKLFLLLLRLLSFSYYSICFCLFYVAADVLEMIYNVTFITLFIYCIFLIVQTLCNRKLLLNALACLCHICKIFLDDCLYFQIISFIYRIWILSRGEHLIWFLINVFYVISELIGRLAFPHCKAGGAGYFHKPQNVLFF